MFVVGARLALAHFGTAVDREPPAACGTLAPLRGAVRVYEVAPTITMVSLFAASAPHALRDRSPR